MPRPGRQTAAKPSWQRSASHWGEIEGTPLAAGPGMDWTIPLLEEIKMDAEAKAYVDEFAEREETPAPPKPTEAVD